ncbi:MAG: hypothetical protein OXC60_18740, partial [Litoreibacter sp.]|nr:hypothetical protein [Litoreibacter sp.]
KLQFESFSLLVSSSVVYYGGAHKLVERAQVEHERPPDASKWTHAMLYVGSLHVLESRPWNGPSSGVRTGHLAFKRSEQIECLVLRHKSPIYYERRFALARRALLEQTLAPQKYSVRSVAHAATTALSNYLPVQATRRIVDLDKAATCSEYVLNCLANGAETLVTQYFNILDSDMQFFPADLYMLDDFEKIPLEFYDLEIG